MATKQKKKVDSTKITGYERTRRYKACINEFLNWSIWQSLRIWDIGLPIFDPKIPTSCVQLTSPGLDGHSSIIYRFNPEFFDNLPDWGVAFVVAHETYHVLLKHLIRGRKKLAPIWNIACDVVINEILLTNIAIPDLTFLEGELAFDKDGKPIIDKLTGKQAKQGGCWTIDKVFPDQFKLPTGKKTRDEARLAFSATNIYNKLMENVQVFEFSMHSLDSGVESLDGFSDGQGKGGKGGTQTPGKGQGGKGQGDKTEEEKEKGKGGGTPGEDQENGEGDGEIEDDAGEETEAAVNAILEGLDSSGGWSLTGTSTEMRDAMPSWFGNKTDWRHIMGRYLATKFSDNFVDDWTRPSRKLAGFYPDVILPSEWDKETECIEVLIAADVSGSMTSLIPMACGLVNDIVKSLKKVIKGKTFKLRYITFDTQWHHWSEADLLKNRFPGGGGTNFQAVEDFIQSQLVRKNDGYPDVVVMVTDGECSAPTQQHPERWMWLLVGGSGYGSYINAKTQGLGKMFQVTGTEVIEY